MPVIRDARVQARRVYDPPMQAPPGEPSQLSVGLPRENPAYQAFRSQSSTPATAESVFYPAPVKGLLDSVPYTAAGLDSAHVLENFWPTTRALEPRAGSVKRASLATKSPVRSILFPGGLAGASETFLFTTDTDTRLVDSSLAAGGEATQQWADFSGEAFLLTNQTAAGTIFTTITNGKDTAKMYVPGTGWIDLTEASVPNAITGVETSKLSCVWNYKFRNYFIEQDTFNAWYLPVLAVSGAATKLPLSGVFSKGGALLFGETISSDSGAGLDDRIVFVSDQGEVAVFTGDPATASSWALLGVYDIGKPFGCSSHVKIGGDLVVATHLGVVSVMGAIQKDPSQLQVVSLAANISRAWEAEVSREGNSDGWRMAKFDRQNMVLVSPPSADYVYVANTITGAWAKFVGWNMTAVVEGQNKLWFGQANGDVRQALTGGRDDGAPIIYRVCSAFSDFGTVSNKRVSATRGVWRARGKINPKHTVAEDYVENFPGDPAASEGRSEGGTLWGSPWGSPWGGSASTKFVETPWVQIGGRGRALAMQTQLVSDASAKLNVEFLGSYMSYQRETVAIDD